MCLLSIARQWLVRTERAVKRLLFGWVQIERICVLANDDDMRTLGCDGRAGGGSLSSFFVVRKEKNLTYTLSSFLQTTSER